MGTGTTRPIGIVQAELHHYLDALPALRVKLQNARPGEEAVAVHREYEREWARFQEVFGEFTAHVSPNRE